MNILESKKAELPEAKEEIFNFNEMLLKAKQIIAKANWSAQLQAKKFQANFPYRFPSFVKIRVILVLYSFDFLINILIKQFFVRKFFDSNLSKHDDIFIFVNEYEEEFAIKYLIGKNGLRGG
ncbi:hypothetical protein H5410_004049 [Solanum commersonii]|uniref:Uncharacterized protein n=1 Tax=Solanum commersonii TaxID=4109 RepID=A0A9J6B6Z7_SOLCO|nr:hypothetical protein H5410_004049 [Solanum commersonii]